MWKLLRSKMRKFNKFIKFLNLHIVTKFSLIPFRPTTNLYLFILSLSNGNYIFDPGLSHLSIYPEIQQISSSLLTNSSGLVGLIIYAYIKKDLRLIERLLTHAVKNFGYIKIMESICKKLLVTAKLEDSIDSPEFHNSILRLYS